jgi:hypothetical protein
MSPWVCKSSRAPSSAHLPRPNALPAFLLRPRLRRPFGRFPALRLVADPEAAALRSIATLPHLMR